MSEAPEGRRDEWARAEATEGVQEGWLPEEQADEYAADLAKSLQGQSMALRFAFDDLKRVLPDRPSVPRLRGDHVDGRRRSGARGRTALLTAACLSRN